MLNFSIKLLLLISMLFLPSVTKAHKVKEVIDVPLGTAYPLIDIHRTKTDHHLHPMVVIRFYVEDNKKMLKLPDNYVKGSFYESAFEGYNSWKVVGDKVLYTRKKCYSAAGFQYETIEKGKKQRWYVDAGVNFYGEVHFDGQKFKPFYVGDGMNTIEIKTEKDLDKILTVSRGLTNWWSIPQDDKYSKRITFFEIPDGVNQGSSNQYRKTLRELLHEVRTKVPDYSRETTFYISMSDGGGLFIEGVPKWEGFSGGTTIVTITLRYSLPFPKYHFKVDTLGNGGGTVSFWGDSLVTWKEPLTVTAQPDGISNFLGWYAGDEKVSDQPTYSFEMPYQDVQLTAHFEKKYLWATAEPSDPNLGSIKTRDQKVYYGDSVSIEAIPNEGAEFVGWKVLNGLKIFSTQQKLTISYFWPYVGDTSPYGYSDKFLIAVFKKKVTGVHSVGVDKDHMKPYITLTGKKLSVAYDALPPGIYLYQGKKNIKP